MVRETTAHMWDPERETISRDDLRAYQGERLREQVKYVYKNSDFFKQLYDDSGISPRDIRGLEDIEKIPTFDKEDLRDYRDETGDLWCGGMCVPEDQLVRTHHSTGTTGKPNFFGLTESDLDKIADATARMWYAWGLRPGDRVNAYGEMYWHGWIDLIEEAAKKIGATPIRSVMNTQNVAEQLFELQPEANFDACHIYQIENEREYIEENDIDPQEVFPNLRFVYSGIDLSTPKRELIEELWGVPFKNIYGSGDQYFTFYECDHDPKFYHAQEDYFIVEVLDPETKEPVEPGEYGEIYITNLWADATPYIRYRMEDLVDYKVERCECGRTHMRVRPLGRLSWCIDIVGRDQPVSSIEIEEVLWAHDDLYGEMYQLVETDPNVQNKVVVRVATDKDIPETTVSQAEADLEETFGVPAELYLVVPDEIGLESTIKVERVAKDY